MDTNLPLTLLQFSAWATRSGEMRTRKLRSHSLRTQSWKVLPLKPGAGQYIAMHATPTARDFFLANFYPTGPFTWFFSQKNMSRVFPVLVVAKTGFCVVTQNKVGHPAHLYRQLIEVPMLSACGIQTVFLGWHFEIVNIIFWLSERNWFIPWNVKCVVSCWFLCGIFNRELWKKKKKLTTAGEVDTTENNLETVLTNKWQTMTKSTKYTSAFDKYCFVG